MRERKRTVFEYFLQLYHTSLPAACKFSEKIIIRLWFWILFLFYLIYYIINILSLFLKCIFMTTHQVCRCSVKYLSPEKLPHGLNPRYGRIKFSFFFNFLFTETLKPWVSSRLRSVTQKRKRGRLPVTLGYVSRLRGPVPDYVCLRKSVTQPGYTWLRKLTKKCVTDRLYGYARNRVTGSTDPWLKHYTMWRPCTLLDHAVCIAK